MTDRQRRDARHLALAMLWGREWLATGKKPRHDVSQYVLASDIEDLFFSARSKDELVQGLHELDHPIAEMLAKLLTRKTDANRPARLVWKRLKKRPKSHENDTLTWEVVEAYLCGLEKFNKGKPGYAQMQVIMARLEKKFCLTEAKIRYLLRRAGSPDRSWLPEIYRKKSDGTWEQVGPGPGTGSPNKGWLHVGYRKKSDGSWEREEGPSEPIKS